MSKRAARVLPMNAWSLERIITNTANTALPLCREIVLEELTIHELHVALYTTAQLTEILTKSVIVRSFRQSMPKIAQILAPPLGPADFLWNMQVPDFSSGK